MSEKSDWIYQTVDDEGRHCYICRNCKSRLKVDEKSEVTYYKYCPNCGLRMRICDGEPKGEKGKENDT